MSEIKKQNQDFSSLMMSVMKDLNDFRKGSVNRGVSSGFRKLDWFIEGFKEGTLNVIASRPAVGKTALAISIATNMAFGIGGNPIPIGFFSFEMNGKALVQRILSNRTHISLKQIRYGDVDGEGSKQLMDIAVDMQLLSRSIRICDTPGLGLKNLKVEIKQMVRDYGVKVVFLDGIDLVACKSSVLPRREMINETVRVLKIIAREMGISIICLCPLSKECDGDRAPILEDLKESDMIERFSDLVILIGFLSNESDKNMRKIIVAKNRDGTTGAFNLRIDDSCCCFVEEQMI